MPPGSTVLLAEGRIYVLFVQGEDDGWGGFLGDRRESFAIILEAGLSPLSDFPVGRFSYLAVGRRNLLMVAENGPTNHDPGAGAGRSPRRQL